MAVVGGGMGGNSEEEARRDGTGVHVHVRTLVQNTHSTVHGHTGIPVVQRYTPVHNM